MNTLKNTYTQSYNTNALTRNWGETSGRGVFTRLYYRMRQHIQSVNYTTWVFIFGLIIFGAVALYYYRYKTKASSSMKFHANSEFNKKTGSNTNAGNKKVAEVLFFYADWCPVCKSAKPVMEDVKAEYENKTVNGYQLKFTDINCTEETDEVDSILNQYNIEGYPTIKLIKDEQVIEYDAKTTKELLQRFFNTVLK